LIVLAAINLALFFSGWFKESWTSNLQLKTIYK
jgi:hypothetical protein